MSGAPDSRPLLSVHGLCVEFGSTRVVDDVDFEVMPGEVLGIVGESGSGKSVTALSILGLLSPPGRVASGEIRFDGEDLLAKTEAQMQRIRGDRISMIFQEPMTSLNPVFTIGDQIAETLREHQLLGRREATRKAIDLLGMVEIAAASRRIHEYPHQLSGGMRQRVMIAMALACQPRLLIADEPTTALDVTVQAQIMRLLRDIRAELGSAMLLITHDLSLVAEYCDRVYVMYAGRLVEEADVFSIFRAPQHPYTRALLRSTLGPDRKIADFTSIDGQPPSLIAPPGGCRFHPRCPERLARCASDTPPWQTTASGGAACWLLQGRDDDRAA